MSLQGRTSSLAAKHDALDKEISEEMQRPLPDDNHVATLKKQKLAIKDEIARLQT